MKKIFKFVLNLITTLAACIPCFLFFNWIGEKGILDWKDILLIMIGVSSIILCTYIVLERKKGKSYFNKFMGNAVVFTITATILYIGFTLMEWIFVWATDNDFLYDWEQKLALSISLVIFNSLSERTNINDKEKKEKTLVVAAECDTIAVAESICAMLKNNEIEAIAVDKESPIYNKEDDKSSQAQVQVCNKDLKKAKELIG